MGVVFAFLLLLVGAMHVTAAFFQRYKHLFPEEAAPTAGLERRGADQSDIAVVVAAVQAYIQG
jgi:Na+-transporting methylmalonyl-CoA/oxaloacetate decarboxylase gamma subunit